MIITRDEEDRLEAALRSVSFADERIVLDSGSTDGTVALAERLGARVVRTDWPGHVSQKNRGLTEARGEWVLSIDADERVTEELARAIRAAIVSPGDAVGFRVARRGYWLGHRLSFGDWYPDRKVRLALRARARWSGRDPHDVLTVDGPIGELAGDLDHHPYRDLAEHLATIDRYTTLDARDGRWFDILVRPPWAFFRAYLLRQGFRDGAPGLLVASLGALYTLLKWARRRVE